MDVGLRRGAADCIQAMCFLMSQAVRRVVGTGHFTISFRKDSGFRKPKFPGRSFAKPSASTTADFLGRSSSLGSRTEYETWRHAWLQGSGVARALYICCSVREGSERETSALH